MNEQLDVFLRSVRNMDTSVQLHDPTALLLAKPQNSRLGILRSRFILVTEQNCSVPLVNRAKVTLL